MHDFEARLAALESEPDDNARNQLALDLADTGRPEVFDALVRLIKRPDLAHRRGTLVHALENYDCSTEIELLAELIATGGYEVAWMAARSLNAIEHASGDHVRRAFQYLEKARDEGVAEEWRRRALEEAIELFE